MTLPELERRGYDSNMAIGTLASASTLGLLIPPSIVLIVYGETRRAVDYSAIHGRYWAGLMILAMFMTYLVLWALLKGNRNW